MLPNGKRQRRTVTAKSKRALQIEIVDLRLRYGGDMRAVDRGNVGDLVLGWLAGEERERKPKTYESYVWAWNRAAPLIGNIRLEQFDRGNVMRLICEQLAAGGHVIGEDEKGEMVRAKPASSNTIRHVARVLQTAFGDAISRGAYTRANPFQVAAKLKPKHKPERGRALDLDEAKRFIAAASSDRYEAAWLVGMTAGLRIGEMFGLKWSDVDLDAGSIFVQRQAIYVAGKLTLEELKTDDSLRLLPIGPLALEALKRRKIAADREPDSEMVFSTAKGKMTSPNNARRRNFAAVKERAKIQGSLTPHDLRHTMNSFGDVAGVPEKVRSERMGHADSAITRRVYTHTIDGQARDAATRIDTLLSETPRRHSLGPRGIAERRPRDVDTVRAEKAPTEGQRI